MEGAKNPEKIVENVAQDAVNQTGFGWFNIKILFVTSLIYVNAACCLGSVGLVIPSASCDFKMSTIEKGRLGMMPIAGMIFGPYFWGNVGDMKGRRVALIASLCIQGFADALSSIISNYYGFLILKFFTGFGTSGQCLLLFTYIGEFQPCTHRDRLLSWLEMPWVVGLILVAGLGWIIIPLDFHYHSSGFFFFNSWNLYVLTCSLLAPLIALWMVFLPETPKYLAEIGQRGKLLKLLSRMNRENTGETDDEYLEKIRKLGNPGLNALINSPDTPPYQKSFRETFRHCLGQTKEIMKPPHLKTTLLMCTSAYCIPVSYFTMIFWFPEIFQRFAIFEELFPGRSASVCTVSEALYSRNATKNIEMDFSNCRNALDPKVFFHNMMLGAGCIPVAIWLPLFIDRFGYKLHFIWASLLSGILAFSLVLVKNSTQNLILSCLFEALASISITIVMCMLVELYPTHLRVVASAFATFIGRIGALVGITLVGYLIDDYCLPLIILIGSHLAFAAFLGIFVPVHKTKKAFIKREELRKRLALDPSTDLANL